MWKGWAAVIIGCLLVARPAGAEETAQPRTPEEALHDARQALEELRYADALVALEAVGPDATPPLRVEALGIGATIHLLEGRPALAQPLLEQLYDLAPGYLLSDPSLPPSVTTVFEAEAARGHARAVKMEVQPRAGDRHGFDVRAGGDTARVEVSCRGSGGGPFLPVRVRGDGKRARFRLSGEGSQSCHIVALDRDGLPLGRMGTALAPISLRPRPAAPPPVVVEEQPVAGQWWFWTSLFGAAATVGVSIAVGVMASSPSAPPAADVEVPLAMWRF